MQAGDPPDTMLLWGTVPLKIGILGCLVGDRHIKSAWFGRLVGDRKTVPASPSKRWTVPASLDVIPCPRKMPNIVQYRILDVIPDDTTRGSSMHWGPDHRITGSPDHRGSDVLPVAQQWLLHNDKRSTKFLARGYPPRPPQVAGEAATSRKFFNFTKLLKVGHNHTLYHGYIQ